MTEGAYNFSKVAAGYDIIVTPASPPSIPLFTRIALIYCGGFMGGGMILVGLLLIFGGGRGSSGGFVAVLFGAVLAGISYLIYDRRWGKRQKNQREQRAFSITPTELRVAGRTVTFPDIHRFILRNHITNQEQSIGGSGFGVVAVPGSAAGAAGGVAMLGEAIGVSWIAKLARISWRVDVEAGGEASTLGGGLDQTAAHGLMRDTMRKIAEIRSA